LSHEKLWAPWRINYVRSTADKESGCFICNHIENPRDDDANLVLWRSPNCITVLNRYPYNNGHLLIAPLRHIADFDDADDEELLELNKLVREAKNALSRTIEPHGFNVGLNFGRCAGAGLPGHLHVHLVPRWNGDTNFMSVCSETDVISQSLYELLEQLKEISQQDNLPDLR
jgi:ATP adenylyltransferase